MATTLRRQPTPAHRPALPGDVRWTLALAHGLTLLGIGLFVATLIAAVIKLPGFALRSIEVRGDVQRVAAASLRQLAVPHLAGNFFTLDLQHTAAAFESVPWVRRAVVQRVWPDGLRVTLEEHQPAALWTSDEVTRLVNRQGEVFEANTGVVDEESLPRLEGPDGSARRVLGLFAALQPLFDRINAEIDTLSLSSRGSWAATLDNGAVVELGRGDDAEVLDRTTRFVQSLAEVTQRYPRPLLHADLRHRDGYALRLAGLTTDAPASAKVPSRSSAARPAANR
jgi:cell division protein FtsQ